MAGLRIRWLLVLALCLLGGAAFAQWRRRYETPEEMVERYRRQSALEVWETDREIPHDKFTFVRIRYTSDTRMSYGRIGGPDRWSIDYPDADLNFSYRLQEMTSLEVDPEGRVLEITDPELFNYPFIYIVEPGSMVFSPEEVRILRRYLLAGGFLMFDDFWGEADYANVEYQMRRVFPEFSPVELPLEHPIFNCVFTLDEKPQIPNVGLGTESVRTGSGITWEQADARYPHYRGIMNSEGRMMVLICQNTDTGDGWEREGENIYFFKEFSEKKAYPLGINIVVYAMTH